MKLEFVNPPQEHNHVILNQYGQTCLSHCFLCGTPIHLPHTQNTYRHICNKCKDEHGGHVLDIWREARQQFPELEEI